MRTSVFALLLLFFSGCNTSQLEGVQGQMICRAGNEVVYDGCIQQKSNWALYADGEQLLTSFHFSGRSVLVTHRYGESLDVTSDCEMTGVACED